MIPQEFAVAVAALRARRPDARLEVRWHASLPSTMDAAAALANDGAAAWRRGCRRRTDAGPRATGHDVGVANGSRAVFLVRRETRDQPELCRSSRSRPVSRCATASRAATGLAADLKWPNDLLVGKRKLAGILAEGLAVGTPDQAIIIGVGVNAHPAAYPPEVRARATSIEDELGRPVDRGVLLSAILIALWDWLARLRQSPGDILQAWRAASPNAIGTRVEWEGRTRCHGRDR